MTKKYNVEQARARKKHEKELIRKYVRKYKKRLKNYAKIQNTKNKAQGVQRTVIEAPVNFSIFDNHDEIVESFNQITKMLDNGEDTLFNLTEINNIDLPTLCYLSAYMLDPRTQSKYLSVRIPGKSSSIGRFFEESQFEEMIVMQKRTNFTNGNFLSKSDTDVNKTLIEDALNKTVTYFGSQHRQKLNNLSAIIVEIVTNTANHAGPDEKMPLPWILNTLERTATDGSKIKKYCLVDLGVGIYSSISDKTEQFRKAKRMLFSWMRDVGNTTQNNFFSKNIPRGIQSTTSRPLRGKGVKYIYELVNSNPIYTKFEIITNKAHINMKYLNKFPQDYKGDFCGTIYSWEIKI